MRGITDNKTKQTLMYAGVVAAAIMLFNLGGGGAFSSRSAGADEPAAAALVAEAKPSREAPSKANPDRTVTTRAGEPSVTCKSGEQKVEQSIADARRKLLYFWEHAGHPAPGEKLHPKVAVPVTRNDGAGAANTSGSRTLPATAPRSPAASTTTPT